MNFKKGFRGIRVLVPITQTGKPINSGASCAARLIQFGSHPRTGAMSAGVRNTASLRLISSSVIYHCLFRNIPIPASAIGLAGTFFYFLTEYHGRGLRLPLSPSRKARLISGAAAGSCPPWALCCGLGRLWALMKGAGCPLAWLICSAYRLHSVSTASTAAAMIAHAAPAPVSAVRSGCAGADRVGGAMRPALRLWRRCPVLC